MHALVRSLCLAAALAPATFLGGCAAPGGGARDLAGVTAAKQAFLAGWTKEAGQPHDFAKVRAACDASADFLSFDAMSEGKTVIDGFAAYEKIWDPGMDGFKTARLSEARPVRTWVDGDLAVTASIARVQGELPDGTKLDLLGHLTLVLRRDGNGWHVVHEHMSTGVKE